MLSQELHAAPGQEWTRYRRMDISDPQEQYAFGVPL